MPYSSLEQVKRYLNINPGDVSEDSLLQALQEAAYGDINLYLSEFTRVPVTDPEDVKILADIEAMWAAGLYRMRLEQRPDIPQAQWSHPLLEMARKRLLDFIERRYLAFYFDVV